MMPGDSLSTMPAPARFSGARAGSTSKTIDYEDGGIAIQDPSRGLLYQRWRARLFNAGKVNSYVDLSAREVPEFVWLTVPNMTEISFSFDANMHPVVAYVAGGLPFLNWFDSTVSAYVTTPLAADAITPRVSLDDKRELGSNGYQVSDVILAYVRGGNLYYRQQRDRYTIERLLKEGVAPLIRIGFTRGLRFQFMHEAS
jgi:hypothetical protein